MERMFKKKIAVRVDPPSSSDVSRFFQVQLSIDPSSGPSDLDTIVAESLCWKLSRVYNVACLFFTLSLEILVVYKRCQSESVDQVVQEICRRLRVGYVGVEEEATSGSVVAQALECSLRCAFLGKNWTCLGKGLFIHSGFSLDDERKHLFAVNVGVQLDVDDRFTLLVSADVVFFSRFKISDLLDSNMATKFYVGDEVILDELHSVYCHVLPSLCEGYVTGVQKGRSLTDDMEQILELSSIKHGLERVNDQFMMIHFGSGDCASKKWFPSAVILRGSGLFPAPKTARMIKTPSGLASFMKIVEGWNFFGQGLPSVKVASSFDIDSEPFSWTKAANAVTNCVSRDSIDPSFKKNTCNDTSSLASLFSVNDFRTPKPRHFIPEGKKVLQKDEACHSKSALAVSVNKQKPQFLPRTIPRETISSSLVKSSHEDSRNAKYIHCIPSSKKIPQKEDVSHGESVPAVSNDKIKLRFQLRKFSKENTSSGLTTSKEKRVDNIPLKSKRPRKITDTCSEATQTEATSALADEEARKEKTADEIAEQPGKITGGKTNSVSHKKARCPADETSLKDQSASAIKEPPCNGPAKRKMDKKENSAKKNQSAPSDQLDVSSKVMECHSKGKLGSLTVAELKSFLSAKRAKVGGKKEELVQRVALLLF